MKAETKKKRGPPPTGQGHPVMVRLQPEELSALDEWRAAEEGIPTRPEALRRLMGLGLTRSRRMVS